jgi:serine/threonine-protein kinase
VSADGQARLAVWGGYNATEDSVQEAFNRVLSEASTRGRSVTHQASTPTKYTVSGYEANGDIYYVRSWLSEGREVTMEWEYPSEMQPIIGPAIQQAADTFRVGPG